MFLTSTYLLHSSSFLCFGDARLLREFEFIKEVIRGRDRAGCSVPLRTFLGEGLHPLGKSPCGCFPFFRSLLPKCCFEKASLLLLCRFWIHSQSSRSSTSSRRDDRSVRTARDSSTKTHHIKDQSTEVENVHILTGPLAGGQILHDAIAQAESHMPVTHEGQLMPGRLQSPDFYRWLPPKP